MALNSATKPRRHKKRKSRTEVSSDSSDSEPEGKQVKKSKSKVTSAQDAEDAEDASSSFAQETITLKTASKEPKNADIEATFAQFYMQRVTAEFADDLEKLRTSDDFKDEAVPMLIAALKAGTSMFSMEEKKRIVLAGKGKGV